MTPCRRQSLAAVLLILWLGHEISAQQQPRDLVGVSFSAHVTRIVDGDTLDVIPSGRREVRRIRLDGIDCPEAGEPFSQRALIFARILVFDQEVRVEGRDIDRYGRLVARVALGEKDLSIELVSAGLACFFRKYSSDPLLARAEAAAKARGLGFWAADAQRPACVAREAGRAQRPLTVPSLDSGFVGNVRSHVYHTSSCPNAKCPNCTIKFDSRAAAEAGGYRPASDCLPHQ